MLYLPREEGQGLVEYALILVLIAVVVIAVLTLLGGQVQGVFQSIADQLNP
jgi:pilus assembly protein Flp/PilA